MSVAEPEHHTPLSEHWALPLQCNGQKRVHLAELALNKGRHFSICGKLKKRPCTCFTPPKNTRGHLWAASWHRICIFYMLIIQVSKRIGGYHRHSAKVSLSPREAPGPPRLTGASLVFVYRRPSHTCLICLRQMFIIRAFFSSPVSDLFLATAVL